MPSTWLILALLSLIGFGVQNFLYKVAAMRGQHSRTVTFYFILISTAFLWSLLFLVGTNFTFAPIVLGLAALDAVLFLTTTVTRMEALRFIPTHLAFPLLRGSTVVVAIVGIAVFGDRATWQLGLSLVLMILAAYLISAERKADSAISLNYRRGLLLSLVALLTSAGTNIVSKLAADNTDIVDYMTLANSLIVIISFVETRVVTGEHVRLPRYDELLVAIGLAISNLAAWFAYLYALRLGPLGSTAVISGMGFIVPILLAALIYKERLSPKRILAVGLTAICVLLIKYS